MHPMRLFFATPLYPGQRALRIIDGQADPRLRSEVAHVSQDHTRRQGAEDILDVADAQA